jgi:3-methyladenine DNA glycosylase/8-oxoguanine DNA glycosylase
MHDKLPTERLTSQDAVARHLEALLARDPRLTAVYEKAGPFPPRSAPKGFVGLAKVVCGQQLSVASANAIWARFEALPGALDPAGYLALDEETVRGVGFSLGKFLTVRAVAEAVVAGQLDFAHVETLPAEEAIAYLTAHRGIGPWTAEIYLMFCAGHPDVFPAGDLALQKAVAHGLGLDAQPSVKQLVAMAEGWSPHRATAALLFWRYYAAMRGREGIVL